MTKAVKRVLPVFDMERYPDYTLFNHYDICKPFSDRSIGTSKPDYDETLCMSVAWCNSPTMHDWCASASRNGFVRIECVNEKYLTFPPLVARQATKHAPGTPRPVLGRPRKYPKGEEKYYRNLQQRQRKRAKVAKNDTESDDAGSVFTESEDDDDDDIFTGRVDGKNEEDEDDDDCVHRVVGYPTAPHTPRDDDGDFIPF